LDVAAAVVPIGIHRSIAANIIKCFGKFTNDLAFTDEWRSRVTKNIFLAHDEQSCSRRIVEAAGESVEIFALFQLRVFGKVRQLFFATEHDQLYSVGNQ